MKIIAGLEPNDMRVINVELLDVSKVAVSFSGGMDSTLLLFMLLKDKEERKLNTEIHCFTATQCGTTIHATNVLALPEFAGKVVHHPDTPNPVPEGIRPLVTNIQKDGLPLYIGANQNPLELVPGRYPKRATKNREPEDNIHTPFIFLYKYHILDAYFKLGIEHILPTTHTCTEIEYGECGQCFACNEKWWAFDKLNKTRV